MVTSLGCVLDIRLAKNAQEEGWGIILTTIDSQKYSKIGIWSLEILENTQQVSACQKITKINGRQTQETEPKTAQQIRASKAKISFGNNNETKVPIIYD
jgi:hypothetical protein